MFYIIILSPALRSHPPLDRNPPWDRNPQFNVIERAARSQCATPPCYEAESLCASRCAVSSDAALTLGLRVRFFYSRTPLSRLIISIIAQQQADPSRLQAPTEEAAPIARRKCDNSQEHERRMQH